MDIEQARFNMVEQQIRPWDVVDKQILNLAYQVPREHYVPEKYQRLAFADMRIPISPSQTMMEPKLEARILQALQIAKHHHVLEIGTGSGYLTACLAYLGQSVVSYEIDPRLSDRAQHNLGNRDNVSLHIGDGLKPIAFEKPFDVIVIGGSLPMMDQHFHSLLTINGHLLMIVGLPPAMQALLITRISDQHWNSQCLFEIDLDPLVNTPRPSNFSL